MYWLSPMKTLRLFLSVVATLLAWHSPLHAADKADAGSPSEVAEKFYAGYVSQVDEMKNTRKWVAASDLVTANFKKEYEKAMTAESVDADPVLNAQDVPSEPFKAEKTETKDAAATVVLVTSFGEGKHRITASLLKVDGVWLLDSVK